MNILVCDDRDPGAIEDAVRHGAGDQHTITTLPPNQLADLIRQFFSRDGGAGVQGYLRSKSADRSAAQIASDFDDYDLVILDNNLGELSFEGPPLTAEAMAGFIRAFSAAPYVVSLNKNANVDFDLKCVVGDFDTKADVALNTHHLEVSGLWGMPAHNNDKFHPWYWPNLSQAAARRRSQVEFVLAHLDEPVLSVFGFPASARDALSARAVGFLSSSAAQTGNSSIEGSRPVSKVTFWNHFQNSSRSLSFDYRAAIALPNAVPGTRGERFKKQSKAPADALARSIIARVVAGELDYWFRRDVLAYQDILIDAPHIKARCALAPDGPGGSDSSVTTNTAPFGLPEQMLPHLAKYAFADQAWIGRPSFWWTEMERQKDIQAIRAELGTTQVWVFCEDTRRFSLRESPNPFASAFVPEGGKPWVPLFVENLDDRNYMPISQFAV